MAFPLMQFQSGEVIRHGIFIVNTIYVWKVFFSFYAFSENLDFKIVISCEFIAADSLWDSFSIFSLILKISF